MGHYLTTRSWRIVASVLISLVFLVASLGVVGAGSSHSNRAASKPVQIAASGRGVAPMKGTVDLAKLPTIKAGAQTSIQAPPPPRLDPLTQAQRAAYEALGLEKTRPTCPARAQARHCHRRTSARTLLAGASFRC